MNGNGISVRAARSSDLDDLVALQLELRDHHARLEPDAPRYSVTEETWRELLADALTKDTQLLLVAVDANDAPCGFAKLGFVPKPWGTSCEVDTLVVGEAHRSKGVGSTLMAAVEETAVERGARGIRANVLARNEDGRRFWERTGYDLIAVRYSKDL